MTKNDLKSKIHKRDSRNYYIVGPNASGKSYFLDIIFNELSNAFYFRESGEVTITENRSRVRISSGKYMYIDETQRGQIRAVNKESEGISENASNIVNYAFKIKETIDIAHISLGTRKLNRIIDSFLSFNLNSIKYILIDEPENSLDDKNLKVIAGLIKTLTQNNYVVVIVTHSPRLLEIMNADLDDIFVFQKPFDDSVRHLCFRDAVNLFDSVGKELNDLSKQSPQKIKNIDKMSFAPLTKLRHYYLLSLLHSIEFYQTLFYLDVFIVEGLTELYLIKNIQNELPFANNYFVANGKFRIPFLIDLFSSLCETVHCFYDTDFKTNKISFSSNLTYFITERYKNDVAVNLYRIPKDIESFLEIDEKTAIAKISNIENVSNEFYNSFLSRYKEYLCLSFIDSDDGSREKIIKLFRGLKPNAQFDNFD